jgi:hypothetical protein
MNTLLKSRATPLAFGVFIISAARSRLFSGGQVLHIVASRRQFSGCYSKNPVLLAVIGTAVVTVISLLQVFAEREEGGMHNRWFVLMAFEPSAIETIAPVTRISQQMPAVHFEKTGINSAVRAMSFQNIVPCIGQIGQYLLRALPEVAEDH